MNDVGLPTVLGDGRGFRLLTHSEDFELLRSARAHGTEGFSSVPFCLRHRGSVVVMARREGKMGVEHLLAGEDKT